MKLLASQTIRDPEKNIIISSVSLLVVGDINEKGELQSLGPIPLY